MARFDDAECFDEESARYFLREVGARVVPNYPFSYGMEEVNSLIVEEYGYDYVPDVWSVLQELLEEDDTASGLGDDGDVWRPWRYPWRHRNVSLPEIQKLTRADPAVGQRIRSLGCEGRQLHSAATDFEGTSSYQSR